MRNSKGGKGLAREERLQVMLAPEELKAIDNFRFQHRMPSRAAAVRELLRYGLGTVGAVLENTGIRSGDYSVLKAPRRTGQTGKRQRATIAPSTPLNAARAAASKSEGARVT